MIETREYPASSYLSASQNACLSFKEIIYKLKVEGVQGENILLKKCCLLRINDYSQINKFKSLKILQKAGQVT